MAHARRSPQHRAPSSSISSPSTARRKTLRRVASRLASYALSEFVTSPPAQGHRPVLVPLQPNLRRLPSRTFVSGKDRELGQSMRDSSHVTAGSKRKRVVSSNENTQTHGRSSRGSDRAKRLRTTSGAAVNPFHPPSDESQSETSEMEVDIASTQDAASDDSDEAETQLEEEEDQGGEEEEEDQSEVNDDTCTSLYLCPNNISNTVS